MEAALFLAVVFFGGIIFVVVWITDHIRAWRDGRKSIELTKPADPMKGVGAAAVLGACLAMSVITMLREIAARAHEPDSLLHRWSEALKAMSEGQFFMLSTLILVGCAGIGAAFQYYINHIPSPD